MSTVRSLCHLLNREKLVHVHFKDPLSLGRRPTTAILIRARSVVQVHPGPPFKAPINTRLFSLFPFRGISLKKPICQLFANFRIGRTALHSGRQSPSVEGRSRLGYVEKLSCDPKGLASPQKHG